MIFELVAGVTEGRPPSSSRTSPTRSATCCCSPPSSASSRSPAGGRACAGSLLGLGVLSTALADAVYLFQSAEGTYVEGTWIDILWPTALLLIASSAWVVDRTRAGLEVEGRPLLAVPAVCALVATGILVYDHFARLNLLAIVLATGTLALVVVRLAARSARTAASSS